jgi:hypothetical protein
VLRIGCPSEPLFESAHTVTCHRVEYEFPQVIEGDGVHWHYPLTIRRLLNDEWWWNHQLRYVFELSPPSGNGSWKEFGQQRTNAQIGFDETVEQVNK